MIAKTSCQQCGQHLEFETDSAGEFVTCPSCGKITRLLLPKGVPYVPALGMPQSHLLWAKIKRPLILFFLLPVAIVGVICYFVHQNKIARDRALREKLNQEYTLTAYEENAVLEKLAGSAALTDLALWEMNHPGWQTGSPMLDANTERTLSNSFFYVELEKIKKIPKK
ncbi:MAG: hypothetical protein P4L87_14280 [Formivibrio sp.]|nr:hypothetical protein [Formivibrio sp.]